LSPLFEHSDIFEPFEERFNIISVYKECDYLKANQSFSKPTLKQTKDTFPFF